VGELEAGIEVGNEEINQRFACPTLTVAAARNIQVGTGETGSQGRCHRGD